MQNRPKQKDEAPMQTDDRQLLLLGLLRTQEMHGYQLNQFLEEHLDFMASLKPSTAYYALDKMAEAGLVRTFTEQEGNRPTRQVYGITPAGEARFQALLRRNLARYEPLESGDDIGVSYLLELPKAEAVELLTQKQSHVAAKLAQLKMVEAHVGTADAIHLTLKRTTLLLQSDLAWLADVLAWVTTSSPSQLSKG